MKSCASSHDHGSLSQLAGGKVRLLRNRVLSGAAALALLITGLSSPAHADLTTQIAPVTECAALTEFEFPATTISSAVTVPSGTLSHRGKPIAEHCLVTGQMNERVSKVDNQKYAIGFELRLPKDWSRQYLYQGNGGFDGAITTALGTAGGSESALQMGMAVISSDAGHNSRQNATFGLDPQARLDYGYQAVATLTPMAKALIETTYGIEPEYSYMAGSSNGGRHAMVGASRYADDYDGFLAVAPSFNRPPAAIAQLWGAQQWNTVATSEDLNSAFTRDERVLVAEAILEQCDALDHLADGMVFDSATCQDIFDVTQHVPTCETIRDGTCLTEEQQRVIANVFNGATTSNGAAIYSSFPYDPGIVSDGWASWKFNAPGKRDAIALGYLYSSPPYAPALHLLWHFMFNLDIDQANESIYATSGQYFESAMDFMTPPDLTYQSLKSKGGKMIVVHGASDGVFSMEDTSAWYRDLQTMHGGDASDFVQYYEVPGMAHTRGGPATDQYNSLTALINWVENNEEPGAIHAWVNPANESLPPDWSKNRSRPLCAYPEIAFYTKGDPERAASFECRIADDSRIHSPRVAVAPIDAAAGEIVTISGTGYAPDATVALAITNVEGQELAAFNGIPTSVDGTFTTSWEIPVDPPTGNITITATDDTRASTSGNTVLHVAAAVNPPSPTALALPEIASPSQRAASQSPRTLPTDHVSSPPADLAGHNKEEGSRVLTGDSGMAALIAATLVLGISTLLYVRKRRTHS